MYIYIYIIYIYIYIYIYLLRFQPLNSTKCKQVTQHEPILLPKPGKKEEKRKKVMCHTCGPAE